MSACADALATYARCFETLSPARLHELDRLFATDARFKDPFNDVHGVAAIRAVFAHMYRTLDAPRFEVLDATCQDRLGYLHWHFHFERAGKARRIEGMSRVQFDDRLKVTEHIDYWDPAEQVYEGIPVLGALLRWLKARLSASD